MARTEVRSGQIKDGEVKRDDLNTTDSGQAVITKAIADHGISISETGADSGTGDVTFSAKTYEGVEVTGTTQQADPNTEYITNNASQVVVTLPSSISVGEKVRLIGKGAGGWRVSQNAGQTIRFGSASTTTGASGNLQSQNQFDVVELICITTDTDFVVISAIGNIQVN